ncbi:hypothetical protein D3C85_1491640 [compost metagenome]
MERARQEHLQLLARHLGEQAVDQADRHADQPHIVEADQHDGPRNGADGFLGRVVIDAVTDPQHLGGERGVAQQYIGQLLHRGPVGLGKPVQVLHHRS